MTVAVLASAGQCTKPSNLRNENGDYDQRLLYMVD